MWLARMRDAETALNIVQAEIDDRCFVSYGMVETDRRIAAVGSTKPEACGETDDDADQEVEDSRSAADTGSLAVEMVSWAVSAAFGRFDVRLATSTRTLPTEPEPFDPLPACSPGMLTGDDGLPVDLPPCGYLLEFPESGVLVDDSGQSHDLMAAIRAAFDVVFGGDADHWWNDVAAILDPRNHDFREWLAGSFFEYHLKRYSRSRRKAPIFWQPQHTLPAVQRLALRTPSYT